MEILLCIISIAVIGWNIIDQQSKISYLLRSDLEKHQQISALKARLAALEPKDEVDQFMDKINKI